MSVQWTSKFDKGWILMLSVALYWFALQTALHVYTSVSVNTLYVYYHDCVDYRSILLDFH